MADNNRTKPAMSPEAREKQLINLSYEFAEKQLRDGTAPPSVVAHFLKLGSTREEKEQEMLDNRVKLLGAQADSIERQKRSEELAQQVIDSMRSYSPTQE